MVDGTEPPWLTKARSYIGFHEQPGNQGLGEFINLAHTGSEGDPWCAIFANACLESSGFPGTRSALARSFETNANFVKLAQPKTGAIATMWRGSKNAGTGHVTFVASEAGGKFNGIGGNQSDQVCEESFAEDAHITGYWWPKTAAELGVATIAPVPPGQRFTGITATVFGGSGDPNTSAYDGHKITDTELGCALPFRFPGKPPVVRCSANGKSVDAPVVDVGPWNVNDPYWETGARPQSESGTDNKGRSTNHAGIDLTPAAARVLGISGKGTVDWAFATTTPVVAPTPIILPAGNQQQIAAALKQIDTVVATLKGLAMPDTPDTTAPVPPPALPALPDPVQLLSHIAQLAATVNQQSGQIAQVLAKLQTVVPVADLAKLQALIPAGGALTAAIPTMPAALSALFAAAGGPGTLPVSILILAGSLLMQILGVVGPALGGGATPTGQTLTLAGGTAVITALASKIDAIFRRMAPKAPQ